MAKRLFKKQMKYSKLMMISTIIFTALLLIILILFWITLINYSGEEVDNNDSPQLLVLCCLIGNFIIYSFRMAHISPKKVENLCFSVFILIFGVITIAAITNMLLYYSFIDDLSLAA